MAFFLSIDSSGMRWETPVNGLEGIIARFPVGMLPDAPLNPNSLAGILRPGPGNLFVLGLIETSVDSIFLFSGLLGGGIGSPEPLAGLLGKKSLRIGTTSLLVAGTTIGAVAPPGIEGGCPPWNGVNLSFLRRAGPNDFWIAPAPGAGGGGGP